MVDSMVVKNKKVRGGNMKYIIACLISLGIVSAGMAQNYSDKNIGAPGKNPSGSKSIPEHSSGYYDENAGDIPSVDPNSNDHFNPNINIMDKVSVKGSVLQDLKAESPVVDINDHLSMNSSNGNENELMRILGQTEFGKACSMKRKESGEQSDMSSAKSFKMKDKNLKMERKASGEERIKFHNQNEFLVYHQKKNGKSHYKYLHKEGSSLLRVEKRKSGEGFVILASGNFDNEVSSVLMEQGAFGVERDVNSCMR
jgi:hypothetical protein